MSYSVQLRSFCRVFFEVNLMHDLDLNPYAPPATETVTAPSFFDGVPQEYRIEKNVMILPPPFVLPEACFLTGARVGLRRCEIPLRVMSKWWNNFIPVVMFAIQALAFSIGIAAQKFKPNLPAWFGSPNIEPILIAVVFMVFAAVFWGIIFGTKKKVTLTGFWTDSESVVRGRRQAVLLVLICDIVLVTGLMMLLFLFEASRSLFIVAMISIPVFFVLTLSVWQRNRKPWSRIGALQQSDGSLAVYGLDPSFLAACRRGLDESTTPPASTRSA